MQVYGGKLDKLNLQKLLFLVCQKQKTPAYDFIPYLYGCYSHSAKADLNTMVQKGLIADDDSSYIKKDRKSYLSVLEENDRMLVNQAFVLYQKMDGNGLMKHTYRNFPYFAINSVTAKQLLSKEEFKKVQTSRVTSDKIIMFTIGYQGVSLEAYLNKLVKNDIRVLIDVRNNPLSQKFGFSKSQLDKYCKGLGITYLHFGDVGIEAEYRQELRTQKDYDQLFENYKKKTLPKTLQTQMKLLELLKINQRVALTCFEADICQCHRKHLSEAITKLPSWSYELKHI